MLIMPNTKNREICLCSSCGLSGHLGDNLRVRTDYNLQLRRKLELCGWMGVDRFSKDERIAAIVFSPQNDSINNA